MPAEKTVSKASENRRSTKPIMEKRRRARINNSLAELKNLILDALKKDNARHSKLEKADILEMTVKHLENLQRQQMVAAVTSDPTVLCKFRAGFSECANEVSRYLNRMGIDTPIRQSLLNHLSKCLTSINSASVQSAGSPAPFPNSTPMQGILPVQPVHVQVPNPAVDSGNPEMLSKFLRSVPLMPTQLPSGEIAFLLPAHAVKSQTTTGGNLLSMCPSPTPSTSSCTSSSTSISMPPTSPSPVNVLGSTGILSPAASDRSATSPSPISPISIMPPATSCHMANYEPISPALPAGKMEEDKVWRPW